MQGRMLRSEVRVQSCKVEMEDEELEVETPTVDASGTVDVPSITADRAAYGGEVGGPAVDVSLPSELSRTKPPPRRWTRGH